MKTTEDAEIQEDVETTEAAVIGEIFGRDAKCHALYRLNCNHISQEDLFAE